MAEQAAPLTRPGSARRPGGVREVSWLAFPIVLSQLSHTAMHVVDSMFVGSLGAASLGALGFANILLWTIISGISGTSAGVQTFVSQTHGAGDARACGGWAWQGLYALVPLAAVLVAGFVALAPALFALVGTSDAMRGEALAFLRMRVFGAAGVAIWMVLAAFFRGVGDARTPLVMAVIANAANIALDYVLIFGHFGFPALGIAGAGLATSIAEWLSALLLGWAFLRRRTVSVFGTRPVGPRLARIRRFLRTGAPIGGQWVLDMSAFALFTAFVARLGDAPMAASQMLISLLSLSFMQAIGIGMATTTLVGRYKGAGDHAAAIRSQRTALGLAGVLATAVAVLFVALPEPLIRLFSDDPEVLRLGRPLLVLGAVFQLFDAVHLVAAGALRGAGDTRWPFLVQTSLAWFLRLPLVWLFAVMLGGGVLGAWIAELVFVVVLAAVLVLRFQRGPWRRIEI